jgi:hypothetical protein
MEARDADTTHEGRAVEKIKLLALFEIQRIASPDPAAKAPKEPRALEKVPIWIIHGAGSIPKWASPPRPFPSTPVAWASSI